jgi:hypothetical protein
LEDETRSGFLGANFIRRNGTLRRGAENRKGREKSPSWPLEGDALASLHPLKKDARGTELPSRLRRDPKRLLVDYV